MSCEPDTYVCAKCGRTLKIDKDEIIGIFGDAFCKKCNDKWHLVCTTTFERWKKERQEKVEFT